MRFHIFKNIIKLAWVNFLWHRHNPYGYCGGWNWATCQAIKKDGGKVNCPCVKYNVHCGYMDDELHELQAQIKCLRDDIATRK